MRRDMETVSKEELEAMEKNEPMSYYVCNNDYCDMEQSYPSDQIYWAGNDWHCEQCAEEVSEESSFSCEMISLELYLKSKGESQ